MKDPRCMVGLHDFSQRESADGKIADQPRSDSAGLYLACTRCQKPKFVQTGGTHTTPGQTYRYGSGGGRTSGS